MMATLPSSRLAMFHTHLSTSACICTPETSSPSASSAMSRSTAPAAIACLIDSASLVRLPRLNSASPSKMGCRFISDRQPTKPTIASASSSRSQPSRDSDSMRRALIALRFTESASSCSSPTSPRTIA